MFKEVEAFKVKTFRQCQSWPQLLGGSLPQRTRSRQSTTEVHSWPWRENCEEKIGFHKKDELSLSFESVYIKRASIGRAFWLAFTISAQLNTNDLYLSFQPRKRSKLWQTFVQMRNRLNFINCWQPKNHLEYESWCLSLSSPSCLDQRKVSLWH